MSERLQQELRQSRPFASREAEALVSVLRTAAVLDHALGEALKPHGVTMTQYNVLRILRGAGDHGLCGRDVGERLIAQVPDVPRLLDRMEDMGLLCRERDPSDRRLVTARISDEGRRLLDRVEPVLEEIQRRRFGRLGAERLKALIDALAIVRDAP